ncbi:MAG: alkaline phosphatase D family protein [Rufibacter sp.]
MDENSHLQNEIPAEEDASLKRPFGQKLDRRGFLKMTERGAGLLVGFSLLGPFSFFGCSRPTTATVSNQLPSGSASYPFKLGVASGDPLPDGVVLWTRLAPAPLTGDGGMPPQPVQVSWEISKDKSFSKINKKGTETAEPALCHSVHVEVEGLEPDTWYYYRFRTGADVSPVGRTKTAPKQKAQVKQLNFAFLSCQSFPGGYYTAYEHLVKEELDVVFFLGDYIYESKGPEEGPRTHLPLKAVFTLEEYRIRYGQYKSDPALQAAHAAFPWIVAPDDHEVTNNWGGDEPPFNTKEFLDRRMAGFQAYYENMPLRKSALPEKMQMQLYRKFTYGNLVEFNLLDTRQYRSGPACYGKPQPSCPERLDLSRTMLGNAQEKWLFNNLKTSTAKWNVLAQQVIFAQRDEMVGPETKITGYDRWDGYVASRNRLFEVIKQNNIKNLVVLTGDSHQNWVNDLKEDFDNPASAVLGTEFGGTSVSSLGNGTDISNGGKSAMAANPHIKFVNSQRGYVRCTLTPEQMVTDFRVVPYIETPGAPINTRATFVVRNNVPGAVQV